MPWPGKGRGKKQIPATGASEKQNKAAQRRRCFGREGRVPPRPNLGSEVELAPPGSGGSALEGQLGHAGLVQFADALVDHLVELPLGGSGHREIQPLRLAKRQRDTGVLRRVRAGEVTFVVAVAHVLAVGLEHAGVGTGLGENLHDHVQVEAKRIGQSQPLGQAGGVDVHHHVDESLHLRGLAGLADIAFVDGEFAEQFLHLVVGGFIAAEHQVQRAVAGLCDAGGHAALERLRAGRLGQALDFDMDGRADGGAVDEDAALCTGQQAVALVGEDGVHRGVVDHHGDDDLRQLGNLSQCTAGGGAEFGGQFRGGLAADVVHGGDVVSAILQPAGHVGAHAADSDKSYFL